MQRLLAFLCAFLVTACIQAKTDYYTCGETGLRTTLIGSVLHLESESAKYILGESASASGAKYETSQDILPATVFWNKGDMALVEIEGNQLPECQRVAIEQPLAPPLVARGNEPFWSARITDNDEMTFLLMGKEPQKIAIVHKEETKEGFRYSLSSKKNDHLLITSAAEIPCQDTMSSQFFQAHATLIFGGKTFTGCAGPLQP